MGYKMNLLEFIKNNENWEEIIAKPPYCIKVKKDEGYVILSYNQIDSDFYNPIVRECRGIILDEETFMPVCIPFYKFGNYGEGYVPDIDWETARTQEKVDGSLIKVWFDKGQWRVSTNGTINAYKAEIGVTDFVKLDLPYLTFGELFDKAKENAGLDFNSLNKDYTYMFELVSPYNKVVVPYKEIAIYHIGARNNKTLEEVDIDIGVKKPKQYNLNTLEDCIKSASSLPYSEEGYVVVDGKWNRVKIKSPQYVAVHHIKNNGDVNIARIIQLIRENELAEFLNYFPEYKSGVETVKGKIRAIIDGLELGLQEVKAKEYETQKDFALLVKDRPYSAFYFSWRKNNNLTATDWVWGMDNNKIKRWIE